MKKAILLIISILLLAHIVYAKDITLSLDQNEYYFKTGENALINLQAENTYKESINGMLSYTLTQSINQGNFQMSSSNTKSTNFQIKEGETDNQLNFGTSDTPMTLTVGLSFQYNKDESRVVQLEDIKIHFVSEESQKQNTQKTVSSSSQKTSTTQQNDPFTQQEQRMQQMINQMFGEEPQQQQQQSATQKLQNNQLSQDSSALKQQMQKQLQEQQALKEEFQKQLAQNPEFQKEHQELLNQGYNITSGSLNPTANNTGTFELNYQKDGEQATLKGEMNNGQLQNMEKDTPQTRQELLNQLEQNKQFQEYQKQLEKQGFTQQNTEFSTTKNQTNIQLNYLNQKNETAQINAEIVNKTIEKVELIKNTEKENRNYWWIIPALIILGLLGYFVYKKIYKKKIKGDVVVKNEEKPFDYKKESRKLLEESKKSFEIKEYKDAYGKAGQALRLYLSYENNLKKEITNDEIIIHLKKHKKEYQKIKECFDMCSLVEFAKYEANKKDYNKIINETEKIIN